MVFSSHLFSATARAPEPKLVCFKYKRYMYTEAQKYEDGKKKNLKGKAKKKAKTMWSIGD